MKITKIPFLLRSISFWTLLFVFFRGLFLAILPSQTNASNSGEWPLTFLYGLKLDLSASAYLTAVPALLWLTFLWTGKAGFNRACLLINRILLFIVLLVLCANLAVYSAWGTLINYRAISFISDPAGIIASLSNLQLAVILIAIPAAYTVLIKIQNTFIKVPESNGDPTQKKWAVTLLTIIVIPILMRGGLQVIPINSSSSWFSESMTMNDAATNPVWYLSDNINRHKKQDSDQFDYMPQAGADSILSVVFPKREPSTVGVFEKGTNIVLIVLESWTSDIISPMGGERDVTPFFTSLCDSGLLFDSVYASGSRTDHMFPSVLSGIPALPNKSLVRFNDKLSRLPMLPKKLEREGYTSLFYYGGELGFANMNIFLRQAGFHHISGSADYPSHLQTGKWGVADGPVLERMLTALDNQPSPFFSMLLTLSTHEPFDVPDAPSNSIGKEPERFRNAARYTDRCLNDFFKKASGRPWFKNTLFVFVADHGHILPKRRPYYDPGTHRIPLLFAGNAIPPHWRGMTIHNLGGQHDLPASLLNMLGLGADEYPFSRNLLDSVHGSYAYMNYEAGIGWKERDGQFVLLTDANRILPEYSRFTNSADSATLLQRGKAYVQCLNRLFESY